MMKLECGHPISAEESVLMCTECDAEERKKAGDAAWNAAIEAAAQEVRRWYATDMGEACANRVRALKREAK